MTPAFVKYAWSEVSAEPISEEAIRERHCPARAFRVSARTYPIGRVTLPTVGVPMWFYVLSGTCRYRSDRDPLIDIVLSKGEFAAIAPGEYTFEVVRNEPVSAVSVFQLPQELFTGRH